MPTYPSSGLGCLKVPVAVISNPRLAAVEVFNGKLVLRPKLSKLLLQMVNDQRIDAVGCLRRYKASCELAK